MSEKTCGNCKWGRFKMTWHNPPRPQNGRAGECEWPMPTILFPLAVTRAVGYQEPSKGAVWPEFANCPVWEKSHDH
jgi:hypothetical protein